MEGDTRGNRKQFKDHAKRFNAQENKERQYRKDQRALQAQKEEEETYEADDSEKFLKKMKAKEEKHLKAAQKNELYEQDMEKCLPKLKGKVGSRAGN